MTRVPGSVRALAGAGALLFLAAPLAAQRFSLRSDRVAVYNLAGEVRVTQGSGREVVVQVTRGGDDAARLRVEQGRTGADESLRVVTPGDRVVYPRMGRGSTSTINVRDDGTFGRGGRRVTISGRGSGTEAYADLLVQVPAGRTVAIHQGVGKVDVSNVNGTLSVNTSSAPVTAAGTRGSLTVDVGSGSVQVQRAEGDVDVDTGSGSVRLSEVRGRSVKVDTGSGSVNGSGVTGETVEVDVGSGSVTLTGVRAGVLGVDTGSGSVDVSLAAPARSVAVDTGSGSVRLAVPSNQGAAVEVDTGSGGIRVDVPAQDVRARRTHYTGRIGDGRGRINVDTGSGSVRIVRS